MNIFEVKSSQLNALAIVLHHLSSNEVNAQLTTHSQRLQRLNELPFFLDLSNWELQKLSLEEIQAIITVFSRWEIKIIGILHTDEKTAHLAVLLGLFFQLIIPRAADSLTMYRHIPNDDRSETKPSNFSLLITRPVRSGQQIYAQNRDLIVTSVVNEGAEIIADGNVHVYAPVRGRVFAGASGNLNARIFILAMQAQLICIAGIYRVFDQKLPSSLYKKNVEIKLQNNKISITAIQTNNN